MTGATLRAERLYSAAARMMCLQDSPSWRNGTWSPARSRAWQRLETALTRADPQPAAEEVRSLANALRSPSPAPGLVLQGPLLRAVVMLLGELRQRLAPGRPAVTVTAGTGELAAIIHELADSLRAPGTGIPSTIATRSRPAAVPLVLPPYDVVAPVAAGAAHAVPTPEELVRQRDFSVSHEAAVAAQHVLALLADRPAPWWAERHEGIHADRHLVSDYRWDAGQGRPVEFAEAAERLRAVVRGTRPPWVPVPADPRPESGEESWALIPGATALVAAQLLDELAARLSPGFAAGPVGFGSYPWFELLGELSSALTNG